MFKTVLVPLDGSSLAELSLQPAVRLARQTSGTIFLMRVPVYADKATQISPTLDDTLSTEEYVPHYDDAAAYLQETRQKIASPTITIRTRVVEGERAEAIVDTAMMEKADLIIMATHARTGIPRWLMGSVASDVLRQSSSPVLLLRKRTSINHIMITLDGSILAEQIIDKALDLAKAFGSKVTFLRVLETSGPGNDGDSQAEDYLKGVVTRYDSQGLEANCVLQSGPVVASILAYAKDQSIDLIAMSTHSRSGLRKMIYGSVTEKVMCNSGCAMLVLRPSQPDLYG